MRSCSGNILSGWRKTPGAQWSWVPGTSISIAAAVQQAGASELVVHGCTKENGYRAESINWQAIGKIRQRLSIPVITNGEIWSWQDTQDCLRITGL